MNELDETALEAARRIGASAADVGFDWATALDALDKVIEETAEVRHELESHSLDADALAAELGDLLFAVVNVARKADVDAERALRDANQKFLRRFNQVLERLAEQGLAPADVDLETMEAIWQDEKAQSEETA